VILNLLCFAGNVFLIAVFGRILLSWFPLQPGGVPAQIASVLFTVTEPVMGPLRRVIPAVGMLDLSPIVVIFGIYIVLGALGC
jgi:YggT family protein